MIESTVAKEHDFIQQDNYETDYLLDDIIKGCRSKLFHTFECKLVYDVKFTNISNNEEANFIITLISMEFKNEVYGLNKRIKIARRNGLVFNQINNLTIKIYSDF